MAKRAIRCAWCGQRFTPKRVGATYCSAACRAKAYRHAHPSPSRRQLQRRECVWCGGSFLTTSDRAEFCSNSHRTLSHRALKASLPGMVAKLAGISENEALDLIEVKGTASIREWIERQGWHHNPRARRWEED